MKLPLVSIVIPCYNAENYIDKGLRSIVNQTYSNKEIICIDNNSDDSTYGILKEWEKNYDEIKVFQENKKGAPHARNLGTKLALGQWIQYFDIDDYLEPNKIMYQIKLALNAENDPDMIIEGWVTQTLEGKNVVNKIESDLWYGLFTGRFGNTNSVITKRSLIEEVGYWDTELASSQERELFFRILKLNPSILRSKKYQSIAYKRENSISFNSYLKGNTLRYTNLRFLILKYVRSHKEDAFKRNKEEFLSEMFLNLRFAYKDNRRLCLEIYTFLRNNGFKIKKNEVSKTYYFLYSLFGFDFTEFIYSKNLR